MPYRFAIASKAVGRHKNFMKTQVMTNSKVDLCASVFESDSILYRVFLFPIVQWKAPVFYHTLLTLTPSFYLAVDIFGSKTDLPDLLQWSSYHKCAY